MSDYNGWTNRETWLVNLHLSEFFEEEAEKGYSEREMANYIEKMIWEIFKGANIPELLADFIDLGAINYEELAEYYVTNASTYSRGSVE